MDDAHLALYAGDSGADPVQVRLDLENETFEEKVKADLLSGIRSGVNGTPTFFITGRRFEGDRTNVPAFAAALDEAARAGSAATPAGAS